MYGAYDRRASASAEIPVSNTAPLIVFDLDGTLVETAPDLCHALNASLQGTGVGPVPLDEVRGIVGQGALAMIERALMAEGVEVERHALKALHDRFLAHYEAHIADESRPFPGAVAALDRLAGQGMRLAICTNKYETLARALLEKLDLANRFAVIAGPDTFGVRKPDPQHIMRTIEAAGGAPERAVMVGDSISDIAAAQAADIPVIGVTFGYTDTPVEELAPDVIVSHFDEIPAAVERCLASAATRRHGAR